LALPQACYPGHENACDAVPSWYPAYAGTPAENRAGNVAARYTPNAPCLTFMRRPLLDAVRSIVAELAIGRFGDKCTTFKKCIYKQLLTDRQSLKLRHFRTFLPPDAPHHSSQKLA
jgi:hypothetical protein